MPKANTKSLLEKYAPVNNVCLMILAATAITAMLVYAKAVLMPFMLAVFFSMVANTIANWLNKKFKISKAIALSITLFVFIGFIFSSVLFISSSIESFISSANIYSQKLTSALDWLLSTLQKFGVKADEALLIEYARQIPVMNMIQKMGSNIFALFTNAFLVTLFLVFMFIGRGQSTNPFIISVEKNISYYLIVKIAVSILAAVCVWIVLFAINAELASMFALLTFLLNFIPNIGPTIATVLPLPVLCLQYGFDWHLLAALILVLAIHFIIGNILETKWLGQSMDLHPLVVIGSLIFWALVWGVMGALLAVPLTVIVKMILERSETTKPIADFMSGKKKAN
ncbi:MAG: AI-2E family transporter [Elusimicrobiaceae bacterium]|nr:AI-2E family transporter [Elusimicrobiaceae bacterium]MBQ3933840.1 AI-2E family transporter [Elusimicrobiaceae bacterium]